MKSEDVIELIKLQIPGALVHVTDLKGTGDHLSVYVESDIFQGMGPMERHRMVQKSLNEAMADGRIHALEIKTKPI
jgi:acid stress-induced BolA-like protein IbaG/YrbA